MNNYNVMVRGIIRKATRMRAVADRQEGARSIRGVSANNPKPNKFISIRARSIDTLPPQGMEYWERLSAFINNNPVQERDLFYMGMLKPLGIEKGKPFQPDARQRAILEEAARIGDAMGRVMLFDGPERFSQPDAVSRHEVALGVPGESRPGDRHLWPGRRAAALHLRRDLHVARPRHHEGRPRGKLCPDVQGQGRQALRRRQVVPSARARKRAGRGLLVADALRHRHPLHDPEPEQRRGPLVLRQAQDRTPTARSICTSGRKHPRAWRATGSRPFPAKAGIPCSASTARRRACSTGHGSCRTSS